MEANRPQTITFADKPNFRPNKTPLQVLFEGAFGGSYFRPIKSSITGQNHEADWLRIEAFAEAYLKDPSIAKFFESETPNVKNNKFGVHAGTSLEDWEKSGWIVAQDPYGWFQWYCWFYYGRRTDDDDRQIDRWLKFTGPKGRFKTQLVNKIKAAKTTHDDKKISPVIRQSLHHWAYEITPEDIL